MEEVETKEEAAAKERYYILLYRSNEPEYGYNKSTNYSSTKGTKVIRCIETGEEFSSVKDAAESVSVSPQSISFAIRHNSKCCGNHYEKVYLPKQKAEN